MGWYLNRWPALFLALNFCKNEENEDYTRMSPHEIAYRGALLALDAHIKKIQADLERYAKLPGAKQSYIDRQWETIEHFKGLSASTAEYINSLKDQIHLLKATNAHLSTTCKLQESEIQKLLASDFYAKTNS